VPDPNVFISQSHQLNVQDLSGDGIFGTIQAAYDWQFAPRWVGGLFVDADLYDIDGHAKQRSSVSTGGINFGALYSGQFGSTPGDATLDAKVGIDWSISVGGRFGWLATQDTLLYVLGAYTHAELENASFEVNITDPANPTVASGLSPINTHYLFKLANDVDGFTLGAGSEVRLGGGWSLKGEYRFTWLDGEAKNASSETFQCTGTCAATARGRRVIDDAAIDMDLDLHTVRGMLAYRF
jgi:outer membrane immunogenic protein